jgi:hypothetical protein
MFLLHAWALLCRTIAAVSQCLGSRRLFFLLRPVAGVAFTQVVF